MNVDYIIVQAGGKGTRMQKLTNNKPKALVPIDNLPLLFHLFKKYPDKHFVVIGDYKYSVLEKYLKAFAKVQYDIVSANGHTGTCSGLKDALTYIPENSSFMLIWCDLLLPTDYEMLESAENVIGISKDFPCRWKYENGIFNEESSTTQGVAGLFIFKNKMNLSNVPEDGEFVRWLQSQNAIFVEQPLYKTHEYGLYEKVTSLPKAKCRPFNKIEIKDGKLYKMPIDAQGEQLAIREINWYKCLKYKHFTNLPTIYEYNPLCMEYIKGKNIYEYTDISLEQKKLILSQIINCLKDIHAIEHVKTDIDSYYNAYIAKTFDRLSKVRDLVPFANDEYVIVNNTKCHNIFYCREIVEKMTMQYLPKEFALIHGDCTFSNMMLRDNGEPVLIDPRGYFGHTELYGDTAYDWVKLYYSLISNYDQFNLKNFDLIIKDDSVELSIVSNNWEALEDDFFKLIGDEITQPQMLLFLALTWLSLTTYAWEDYDSICGSFYNGLYYLERALNE